MRVLIIGAGAVGSLLGHRLATAGHAVTLVGRTPWMEAIQSRGLGLKENGQLRLWANLTAVADAHAVAGDAFDLVVCATKVYDMVKAIQQIAPVASKGIPLLTLQNGVGGEELASEVLPQTPLVAGVVTLSVEVLAPGKICLATTSGGIGLAPVSPGAAAGDLVIALRQAGFARVRAYADYRAMKWSKLLLNILGNALPTILGMPPAKVYAQRELFDLERTAFAEALTVVQNLGLKPVSLPGYPVPLLVWGLNRLPGSVMHILLRQLVASGRGGKMPSLYLDLIKGKPKSEVDFMNGAVVDHARSVGLGVPVNQILHSTLKAIVSGETPWHEFRGQPRKLVTRVGCCT
jgi:2-dehydropantoate 2-reductase